MKRTSSLTLFAVFAVGVFASSLCGNAASKTDTATPDIPKPAAPPPAPQRAPTPPAPAAQRAPMPAPRPTLAPPHPAAPVRRERLPVERTPLPAFPLRPRPTAATAGTPPIKSYPPPFLKSAPKNEPVDIPFFQTVVLAFSDGDSTAYAELLSAEGRRIDISHCDVQWFLPKYQTGSIDFAATQPDNTYHPPGSLSFGADPGKPLKIYGRRTGVDGSAKAILTFYGEQTPVPREEKNPTDL